MFYEWIKLEIDYLVELYFWFYCSLFKWDFVWFMSGIVMLMMMLFVVVFGIVVLWGVLLFMLIVIWVVWYVIGCSYKDGELFEVLVIELKYC